MAGMETVFSGNVSSGNASSVNLFQQAVTSRTDSSTASGGQFDSFLKSSDSQTTVQQDKTVKRQLQEKVSDSSYVSRDKVVSSVQEDGLQGNTGTMPENNADALQKLQDEIKSLVKETLGIDEEQLTEVMGQLGIGLGDLLQPEVLQQFVLQVSGGDEAVDFLTDESMMADFSDLLQGLTDLVNDNQALLSMMEVLDEPVTLSELLNQDGISFEIPESPDAEQLSFAKENAVLTEVQQTAANTAEDAVWDQVEKVVVKTTQEAQASTEESTQTQSEENTEALLTVSEEADGAESDGAGESTQQDSLTWQSEALTQETAVEDMVMERDTQPLFSELLHTVSGTTETSGIPLQNSVSMQQMIDIVNQVTDQIQSRMNAETTTMEMQLHPESLGKVYLTVAAKEGAMTANLYVQSDEARYALESQIATLRENLEVKNIKVESIDVHISDFSFDQSTEAEAQQQEEIQKQAKKRFRYQEEDDSISETEKEESAEAVRRRVMRDRGTSIDFTA